MNLGDPAIPKKYFTGILLFSLANISLVVFLLFLNLTPFTTDFVEYADIADYFSGDENVQYIFRILRPLVPAMAAVFSWAFGQQAAFIFVNSVFFLFSGFLVFKIAKMVFRHNFLAFLSSIFFLSAYPMLNYGIPYITDVAGWFFFVLSVYLTLLFAKNPSWKLVALNALVCGVGGLAKESGAVGAIFFTLFLLFLFPENFGKKLKFLLLFGGIFLAVFLPWQMFIYLKFHYSFVDWFAWNNAAGGVYRSEMGRVVIKSLGAAFLAAWLFVLYGAAKFRKMPPEAQKFILLLVLPSFTFLIWSAASSRLFYIIGLLLSALAAWGFVCFGERIKNTFLAYGALATCLAGNYFWLVFDDRLRHLIVSLFKVTY
jgi:hypothetical protein